MELKPLEVFVAETPIRLVSKKSTEIFEEDFPWPSYSKMHQAHGHFAFLQWKSCSQKWMKRERTSLSLAYWLKKSHLRLRSSLKPIQWNWVDAFVVDSFPASKSGNPIACSIHSIGALLSPFFSLELNVTRHDLKSQTSLVESYRSVLVWKKDDL